MHTRFTSCILVTLFVERGDSFSFPQTATTTPTSLNALTDGGNDSSMIQQSKQTSRRRQLFSQATAAVTALATLPILPALAASSSEEKVEFSASWSAVDGLNQMDDANRDNKIVGFDLNAYKAMRDDKTRTPLFEQAIQERLGSNPENQVVLDMGTGPFCLFAVIAAQLGAGKVYAIEANQYAAASARDTVERMGYGDIITVVEGYSTKIQLPENVDFCIAEIIGSVASEEGAIGTIADARRFLKEPSNANNWIPQRIQTYAAPASYTLHSLFGPPEFDWAKLKGEPVRFNCRDKGLELLADPQVLEDISFHKLTSSSSALQEEASLKYIVDKERVEQNVKPLFDEFRQQSKPKESEQLAFETSHSFSGIAMWPRLFLNDHLIVNSREYPTGNHQKSHWQTVLPVMPGRPIGNLKGGETISIDYRFELPMDVTKPPRYNIQGVLDYSTTS